MSKFVVASHPNVEAAINCDKVEAISRRPPATVAEHKRRIVATTHNITDAATLTQTKHMQLTLKQQ